MTPGNNQISYSGAPVSFTVPLDGTITAYVYGAAGAKGTYGLDEGGVGGGGGYIVGTFNVTATDTIYVNVGGINGYNGGGIGNGQSGIGGGFSSVGLAGAAAPPYLLVAGGGGGGGALYNYGGGGGDNNGGNGVIDGGIGGQTNPPGAGDGSGGGDAGTLYVGGDGASAGGGGGGGGYWGGGGGGILTADYNGGGGGSSYAAPSVTGVQYFPPTPNSPLIEGQSSGTGSDNYVVGVGDTNAQSPGFGDGLVVLFYTQGIVCFLKGTLVLTPSGNIPIENVRKNSFVYNQHGKPIKVIYTTSRTFSYAAHPDVMYKIPKDALGNTTDLFVTKQHPFFINGERKEARDLGFSVAAKEEVVDENGNITVYNISIVDGNTKNLILVNGHCEIGTGE